MKHLIFFILFASNLSGQDCTGIDRSYDDFTGNVSYLSPVNEPVSLIKHYKGKDTLTFVRLESYGFDATIDGRGVTVLFQDGTKWEKPNQVVNVNVSDNGRWYVYTAFIELAPADTDLFASKLINKYRLYIHDHALQQPDRFRTYFDCIRTK